MGFLDLFRKRAKQSAPISNHILFEKVNGDYVSDAISYISRGSTLFVYYSKNMERPNYFMSWDQLYSCVIRLALNNYQIVLLNDKDKKAIYPAIVDDVKGDILSVRVYNPYAFNDDTLEVKFDMCEPVIFTFGIPNGKSLRREWEYLKNKDRHSLNVKSVDLLVHMRDTERPSLRKKTADEEREEFERQMNESTYGVAYVGSNSVTQLNRPVSNAILDRVEAYKIEILQAYGIPKGIVDGSATQTGYYYFAQNCIWPYISCITSTIKNITDIRVVASSIVGSGEQYVASSVVSLLGAELITKEEGGMLLDKI